MRLETSDQVARYGRQGVAVARTRQISVPSNCDIGLQCCTTNNTNNTVVSLPTRTSFGSSPDSVVLVESVVVLSYCNTLYPIRAFRGQSAIMKVV